MSMARALDVIGVGRAAVDLYGEQIGGRLEDMQSFAKYLGGSPANTTVGASRLGLRAAMLTRVGDEHNGRFVRETLAAEGVDVSQVRTDPKRLTALVFLGIRDADTFPLVFYRDHCADMGLGVDDVEPAFIASSHALLISGTHLSQPQTYEACLVAMRAARAAGTRVVLDIDYRPVLWGLTSPGLGEQRYVRSDRVSEHLQTVLPLCDLIVGTEEEVHIAGGSPETLAALRRIRELSSALIVMKRGPMGCVAFPDAIPMQVDDGVAGPGFPVEVIVPSTTQLLLPSFCRSAKLILLPAELAEAMILPSIPLRSRPCGRSSARQGSAGISSSTIFVPTSRASCARSTSVDALRVMT